MRATNSSGGESPRGRSRKLWLLGGSGLTLGILASLLTPGPSGCIYHDTCIKVTSPGHDWRRNLANALQWPADGSIEDAVPVTYANGATPRGTRCFNDAEHQILEDETPRCKYDQLIAEIENAARQECQSLVLPGFNHNCWQATGANASIAEGPVPENTPGACIGNCKYGGPPSDGSCPELNPYECATGGGDGEMCGTTSPLDTLDTGSGDPDSSGGESDGIDTSGGVAGLDAYRFITCEGTSCEIDESFAAMIYDDPALLLREDARLDYDSAGRRHVFVDVEPGSVAHTLGFRSGDRLESVDGVMIDGLEAALDVYVQAAHATTLDVRVRRGEQQWLDFEFLFVR
ncbi:MAG: PDZ domain-containing protein [Myxococcota bacterium]